MYTRDDYINDCSLIESENIREAENAKIRTRLYLIGNIGIIEMLYPEYAEPELTSDIDELIIVDGGSEFYHCYTHEDLNAFMSISNLPDHAFHLYNVRREYVLEYKQAFVLYSDELKKEQPDAEAVRCNKNNCERLAAIIKELEEALDAYLQTPDGSKYLSAVSSSPKKKKGLWSFLFG